MTKTKLQYATAKDFTKLFKSADDMTKAMILGMLIMANADGLKSGTADGSGDDRGEVA